MKREKEFGAWINEYPLFRYVAKVTREEEPRAPTEEGAVVSLWPAFKEIYWHYYHAEEDGRESQ
jgi:hypothetical protein